MRSERCWRQGEHSGGGGGARRAGVKTGAREEAREQRMLEVPRGRCGYVGRSQGLNW